jgi:hypothetical protein
LYGNPANNGKPMTDKKDITNPLEAKG